MTPRMKADATCVAGWHTNRFWPGAMHSDWERGPVKVRRERIYTTPERTSLKEVCWQVYVTIGKHKIGLRWERKI